MKAGLFLRLKFAWKAFMMQNYKHTFPYQYHCNLVSNAGVCDNNRRESKCENMAKVALANPSFVIELKEAEWFYHVCQGCAKKYIGSLDGETTE